MSPRRKADNFSTLFEFLPIGAYRSSPQGHQLRANLALARLNGYATEAEQLASVSDIAAEWYVSPTRRAEFMEAIERDGQVVGFESEIYRHKTRERIWVSENAHVVRDARGRVRCYEGTVEEITERVAAREALRHSQEQLQRIMSLMPGMVYRVVILPGGDRRCTFVSEGVRQVFELEPADILGDGKLMHRLRHVDDRARIEVATDQAARSRQPLELEYRVQLHSGRVKWVRVYSIAAPPEGGHPVRIGLVFDVTERRLAEQALIDNGLLWKRVLESSGDGVWDWQVQAGIEVLSPQCKALYGYADDELPDTPDALDLHTHPDDLPAMRQAREDHFAGRTTVYTNEHRVRCRDGRWKWILTRGIVISRDDANRPLRMVGTHTDITAAREAAALRHERDRAEAADLAKSQLLSRVSHELRTPLNAVLGFAQLLKLELGESVRQRGWLDQVQRGGEQLLALIDDLLDLASAQTGEMRVQPEPLSLVPLMREVLGMMRPMAMGAQLQLLEDGSLAAHAGLQVRADGRRLRQVLGNLLSNAIKYNRRGGWVRVALRQAGDQVEIQVADSGPGLSPEQRVRLFQPFERLSAAGGPVTGTGLGLALSRQLALAMGGSLEVDSESGRGAVFTLSLPAVP